MLNPSNDDNDDEEILRLYRETLDAQIPPPAIPRALLRSRMAAAARPRFPMPAALVTACVALFAAIYIWRTGDLSTPKTASHPAKLAAVTSRTSAVRPLTKPASRFLFR